MIYELRTYEFDGSKRRALYDRFRDHAIPILERHGVSIVGFWEAIIGANLPRLVYMFEWKDMAEREKRMGDFYADPEWVDVVAKTGSLILRMHVDFLTPTDFSRPGRLCPPIGPSQA